MNFYRTSYCVWIILESLFSRSQCKPCDNHWYNWLAFRIFTALIARENRRGSALLCVLVLSASTDQCLSIKQKPTHWQSGHRRSILCANETEIFHFLCKTNQITMATYQKNANSKFFIMVNFGFSPTSVWSGFLLAHWTNCEQDFVQTTRLAIDWVWNAGCLSFLT